MASYETLGETPEDGQFVEQIPRLGTNKARILRRVFPLSVRHIPQLAASLVLHFATYSEYIAKHYMLSSRYNAYLSFAILQATVTLVHDHKV